MSYKKLFYIVIFALQVAGVSYGQNKQPALTPAIKANVVDSLCAAIRANYIFADTGALMTAHVREGLKSGRYDRVTDPVDFAKFLTDDLHAVYKDKHLDVLYEPDQKKEFESKSYIQIAAQNMQAAEQAKEQNFGFARVEILSGDIGYIVLNRFFDLNDQSKQTVNSAFDFLIHTKAIIIDLRLNGGGQADIVNYIISLFFKVRTHINDFLCTAAKTISAKLD